MISVYRITLGIRTGFLSITEKPNKTGIFCNPRNWARGVPARRSSVTATMAPKNQPSSGTREYGFQRFRNRDLPRPEFAPFPLSPPIRRLVSHLANRLTHRERRCAASGKARDRGVLYSTARERNAAGARGLSPEGSAAEAKRMRRQTAKDDRARRRRTPGTPSRAQGVRQRAGGADRAAGAGRPQGCLFCCDKRSPGCVGRACCLLVRRTDRTPPRSLLRLPASPRVSPVPRRNPSGDRPPPAALECNRICEMEHLDGSGRLREALSASLRAYGVADLSSDPVRFPHRFEDRADIEVAAFLAASFAFGNVVQILAFLEKIFGALGPSPHAALTARRHLSPARVTGLYHRFISGEGVHRFLLCVRAAL